MQSVDNIDTWNIIPGEDTSSDSNEFEDVATSNDFRSTRSDIKPPGLKKDLYLHQLQTLAKCLEAEGSPPIETDEAQFYSRFGVNANSPGSGKTATMLGLGFFDVEESACPEAMYSTALTAMFLKDVPREKIQCSVYLAANTLVGNWKADCDNFYGRGKYWEITTYEKLVSGAAESDGELSQLDDDLKTTKSTLLKLKKKRNATDEDRTEVGRLNLEVKRLEAKRDSHAMESINNYIIRMMKKYRIIVVGHTSFQFLFPVFKRVKVARLVIDELQDINITNQSEWMNNLNHPILNWINGNTRTSGTAVKSFHRELPPAEFIWCVTATPQHINSNRKTKGGSIHYFNEWIGRNAPFITDYINSVSGNYTFPEMVSRYIIKFPDYYISGIIYGDKDFVRPTVLKIKRPAMATALQGVLGTGFDDLLENDDYDGIMKKLQIEDPSQIFQATIDILQRQIDDIRNRERDYDVTGERLRKLLEKNQEEIDVIEEKIAVLRKKEDMLNGHIEDSCPVCYEELEILGALPDGATTEQGKEWAQQSVLCCGQCYRSFHAGCIFRYFKGCKKDQCPMCKFSLNESSLIKLTKAGEAVDLRSLQVAKEEEQSEEEEGVFENKMDALMAAVEGTQKCLVYLNTSGDENTSDIAIVKKFLDMGFAVRYPTSMSLPTKNTLFGRQADMVILPRDKRQMQVDLKDFENTETPTIWLMKTSTSSSGLNLPFIDRIVCYSRFASEEQIKGRALRPQRTEAFDYVVLEYES